MDRQFVAQKVASRLNETEAAVEAAIAKTSTLLADLYQAKIELGLAGTAAAEETAGVGRAVAALQAAHSELVGSHHGLLVLARALRLRPRAAGWKPDSASAAPFEPLEKIAAA